MRPVSGDVGRHISPSSGAGGSSQRTAEWAQYRDIRSGQASSLISANYRYRQGCGGQAADQGGVMLKNHRSTTTYDASGAAWIHGAHPERRASVTCTRIVGRMRHLTAHHPTLTPPLLVLTPLTAPRNPYRLSSDFRRAHARKIRRKEGGLNHLMTPQCDRRPSGPLQDATLGSETCTPYILRSPSRSGVWRRMHCLTAPSLLVPSLVPSMSRAIQKLQGKASCLSFTSAQNGVITLL